MKKFTLFFVGFFCISVFLSGQNSDIKTYFDGQYVAGLADDGQILWVGVDNLLVKMDKTSGETSSYVLPNPNEYLGISTFASSISLDQNGTAWIVCAGPLPYLERFNLDNSWTDIPLPSSWFSGLVIDQNDKVWASTIAGLHEYDGMGWIDYNCSTNVELPYSSFTALAVDNFNNKWLGLTFGLGEAPIFLVKFNDVLFTLYTSALLNGTGGMISSIDNGSPSTVWMGTHENGLVKFDGIHWEAYNTSNSELPSNSVQNVTVEGANNVWMSTEYGLTRFDGDTWKTFDTNNSNLPSNTINSIMIDANTTKWVATDLGLISFAGSALSVSDELYSGVEFKLFPNPAKDVITLKMSSEDIGSTIEVFNILGKAVKTMKMTNNSYKMDVSDLANGMYLIRVHTKNGLAIKKLVIRN